MRAYQAARVEETGKRAFQLQASYIMSPPDTPQEEKRGLAMSRSLGDRKLKEQIGAGGITADPDIETRRFSIGFQPFLISASDGVWDVITTNIAAKITSPVARIATELAKQKGLDEHDRYRLICSEIAKTLVQRARQCGSTDDISAVVSRLYAYQPAEVLAPISPAITNKESDTPQTVKQQRRGKKRRRKEVKNEDGS